MTSLECRFTPWLDVVTELVRRPSPEFPHRLLMRLFAESFDESVGWNAFGPGERYELEILDAPPGFPDAELVGHWISHAHEHPLFRYHLLTGARTAMTTSRVPDDMVTRSGRQAVIEYLRPYGRDEQLAIPCGTGHGRLQAFVISRTGADFSDEALLLARRLQPLLALLARQSEVLHLSGAAVTCDLGLTGRELAILALLDRGLTASAIGHRLSISPRTVHTHLRNIYRKLGVADRLMASRVAHEAGLLPSVPPSVELLPQPRSEAPTR
ncbi:response regulator transcription factor [Nocardioides sp. GXQ0305]|uniref:response regulator transcription factor n=1 Tax=Nocardioides sp. GXQ0305 TaxID=3423912 RepID=UPI003D7DE488